MDENKKREFWITPHTGVDGTEIKWGNNTYLNPTFRNSDGQNDKGPTAFIRKAIGENKKGKTVLTIINTNAFINITLFILREETPSTNS